MRARLPRRLRDDRDPSQSSSPWRGGGCNDEESLLQEHERRRWPLLVFGNGPCGQSRSCVVWRGCWRHLAGRHRARRYVAGTIAMSGANGAVVVEVTNVGDEAVEIQQGDQFTTIEPGATSMFSSDFCAQRLCMANSQILQNGSARAVRPRRRRAARDRSLVPRSRAGSIGIGLFSEGDHTGRMGGRPAVWKPWWRAARSYRQGRSSNANGLRWRVLARASRNYLNISNT